MRLALLALILMLCVPLSASAQNQVTYLSSLTPISATNGWGPYERDMSNGDSAAGDGHILSIRGNKYTKGLGVHANGELNYTIPNCDTFSAYIGIDDEQLQGSVIFTVYTDGDTRYVSDLLTGTSPVMHVNLSVRGRNSMLLSVATGPDPAGQVGWYDHADWADAKFTGCAGVAQAPSVAMPGALPGWNQVFAEDFNTPAAVGQFRTVYGSRFSNYNDGWTTTANTQPVRRCSSQVVSVANSAMIYNLHQATLKASDPCSGGTAGTYWLNAVEQPNNGANQLSGRYSTRFMVDGSLPGHYLVPLLWPRSENWPWDGEIDFPEGGIDSTIQAFMHRQNGTSPGDQDYYSTNIRFDSGWHIATTEWVAGQYVSFQLDGVEIGRSTQRVPNTPMRYVMQSETCWGACPATGTTARILFDWVVIYSKA